MKFSNFRCFLLNAVCTKNKENKDHIYKKNEKKNYEDKLKQKDKKIAALRNSLKKCQGCVCSCWRNRS